MSPIEQRHRPVHRQLEVYQDSWQRDHNEAMACRDVEDTLAVGISLFHLLERAERSWRDRVFRGAEDYSGEQDEAIQGLYRAWLQVSAEVRDAVPDFENRFGSVDGAAEFRECVRRV